MKYERPVYEVVIKTPDGNQFTVKKLNVKTGETEGLVTSLFLSGAVFLFTRKAPERPRRPKCFAVMYGIRIIAWEMAHS